MGSDRAVSTVMDIALALLIISASVLMIAVYLDAGDDSLDQDDADRTAETLTTTTVSATYNVSAITDSDHFEDPETPTAYDQATHGPAATLLAEAAVTDAQFDGEPFVPYNDSLEDGVDATIQSRFAGGTHQLYATASWEPYDNSSIKGTATTGNRPPVTEDTSSATTTVSSEMPELDKQAIARSYATAQVNNLSSLASRELAEPIAESIVAGYFPPEDTQLALEDTQLDRSLLVAHSLRLAEILDGDDPAVDRKSLERTEADADTMNSELAADLADMIEQDIETGPIGDELEAIVAGHDMSGTTEPEIIREITTLLENRVNPDQVVLSIQIWYS